MAKKGKYASTSQTKEKRNSLNPNQVVKQKSTQKQKLPKNASKPTETKQNTERKRTPIYNVDLENLNQTNENPVGMPELQKKVVIDDDDPATQAIMSDVGLSVEEIMREIENPRPDPQAYVHRPNESTTANAVEYKNPMRLRQQAEKEKQKAAEQAAATAAESPAPIVKKPAKKQTHKLTTRKSINKKKPASKKKKTNNRPKKEREPFIEVYDYESSIKQAERDGTIAGLYCLLFMGIIVGAYALLSKIFPVISVDYISDKLIEAVMMSVVGEGPIAAFMNFFMGVVEKIFYWCLNHWPLM